ncbi:M16 family metallopeptidase [Pedobacter nyackensis]|uniref:M16 family metallopeptidase n=1 Tax=Pedobacter nyackensis TaxID=475255 RepID=UPI00292EE7F2|nr:insulinase family protein [Pedobacter nyackensis]
MKIDLKVYLLAIGLLISMPEKQIIAQQKIEKEAKLPYPLLPIDKDILIGKLPNGFTYYIRKNTEPGKRVVLYLVNKVGSVLEEDHEVGLAHFVEHMAFNGTKNFPENELVSYLERMGVRFGADLNAYTSFDETVYQLPIPSDKPENITSAIQIMRDWSADLLMDDKEIEAERGVILEERRLRKGVSERIREVTMPAILNNSRYVKRMPIGTEEVLKTFKPETIKHFYKKWYRPNLQALIVVGDIDVKEIEKQIKAKFSDLTNPKNAPERITYTLNLEGKNDFVAITDPEISSTSMQLLIKKAPALFKTEADLRNSMVKTLFNGMLTTRLGELSKQEKPPFKEGKVSFPELLAGLNSVSLTVIANSSGLEKGFKAVLSEVERVRQLGFTQTELDRVKGLLMDGQEYRYNERSKVPSAAYADEYVKVFLKDQASPGSDFIHNFYKTNIQGITLEEVNAVVNELDFHINRNIIITAPETEKANLPTEEIVLSWIKEVKTEKLAAYNDVAYNQPLMTNLPAKGKILKESYRKDVGITTWTLSNGMKVVFKPTDFNNDQILFSSFSPGGNSIYSDSDYQSALNATSMVVSSGLGEYDSRTLPKILSGKSVSVSPYISERYEGINGQSRIKDLETAFQLIYLYFTAPRLDHAMVNGAIENAKVNILKRYNNPDNVIADTIGNVLGQYHYRRTAPSLEKMNQISPERALEIFKDRFSDASDFTFVFTGSLNIDSLKPLFEQYLAALPSLNRKEAGKDLGIRLPKGEIKKTVFKGKEEKATVQLMFSGKYNYSDMNNWNMKALQEVLKLRLIQRLREKEGGVYSSDVSVTHTKLPVPSYSLTVSFGCAPENVERLILATKEEMAFLVKNGPSDMDIQKYKAEEGRMIELALKKNSYWHNNLVFRLQSKEDPAEILKVSKLINSITKKSVQGLAKKYLGVKDVIQFVLLPEKVK